LGFYESNAKDISRTDLFDPGVVRGVFGRYKIQVGSQSAELEMTTAPGSVSDWSFSRITVTMNADISVKRFGILDRMAIGKIWSDDEGVPTQERYTIEGAGSGDIFSRPYLRDESSFYGITELRSHYHLAGDANLRGYVGKGYAGTESIISNTAEVYYSQPFLGINFTFAGFVDAGFLWGSEFEQGDNGFDGDFLADAGLGIRLKKKWFGKSFYLRLDSPFWLSTASEDENSIDFSRWVFSFSSGI
jgi:outer membrane protein assembly factor BamA